MARSLPESPDFESGHEAERAAWERLVAALPDDAVVCHSVQVRDGAAEHEIDLLVLWPHVGIACIEVKGGRASVEGGQWYQSDRGGRHRIKSPVAQAQSAMHGFRNMVGDHLGTPLTSRMVYFAAFPYTDVPRDWAMAGVPRSLVLDRRDLDSPLDLAEALRGAIHAEASGHASLAPEYAARLERFVAGSLAEDGCGGRNGRTTAPSSARASMFWVDRPIRSSVVITRVSPSISASRARSNSDRDARALDTG